MDRVALITGAAGGVGSALAERLAADGWALIVASRSATRLSERFGDRHLQVAADCSTMDGAQEIFARAEAAGLLPSALAHCVGNIRLGALHRLSVEDYRECMRANLDSAVFTCAAFAGALRGAGKPGAAVLVSSAAAGVGTPNHEAVAAAKGGVEALVRGAAATYAGHGIRFNAVAPGIMDTPAAARVLANEPARAAAARQYPIAGVGKPGELADLMAWLLSERAARVTGQVWSLDGGFAAVRPLVR